MGNSIIKNSRNFIVKVYVDNYNYNKDLCVLYIFDSYSSMTDNV